MLDLARCGVALEFLLAGYNAILEGFVQRAERFTDESQAPEDEQTAPPKLIAETIGIVNIRVAAAMDHVDSLVNFTTAALAGSPTPTFPPFSVSRSALEALSEAAWLLEPNISASRRGARVLSLIRREYQSQRALGYKQADRTSEMDQFATKHGYSLVGEGFARGYEEAIPGHATLVRRMLHRKQATAYSEQSAAAHGETWALIGRGYTVVGDLGGGLLQLRKTPTADGLRSALSPTYEALGRTAWLDLKYRDNDRSTVRALLESAHSIEPFINEFWK